jgi:hypothetical protein
MLIMHCPLSLFIFKKKKLHWFLEENQNV